MNILPLICLAGAILAQSPAQENAPDGPAPTARPEVAAPYVLASESQKHMGTEFTIQVYHRRETDPQPAMKAAFERIAALDGILSDYDPESELSRLSASSPHAEPVEVSEDLYRALEVSQQISERTGGAFDVTVGPLTKLWRQARRQKKKPDDAKLKQALEAVGWQNMKLSHEPARTGDKEKGVAVSSARYFVQLTKPNMRLDLGGIGQGYAADKAYEILGKQFPSVMINASGDIRVGVPPPGKRGWKIGLTGLNPKDEKPTQFVLLRRPAAISTSGDAFQFVEVDGKRYSHIVDPDTGMGLTTPMSVTVIAADCTLADAYASALCVMGPDEAKAQRDWNASGGPFALFVINKEGKVETIESPGFGQFRDRSPTP